MTYKTDITEIQGILYLGITNEENHRWLLTPSDELPEEIKDEEVIRIYNNTYTQEVKDKYQELLDSRKPSPEQQESERVTAIKNKCSTIIYGRYSQPKQSNAALGLESEEFVVTMKAFIVNIKQQCKDLIADTSKTYQDYNIPEEEK